MATENGQLITRNALLKLISLTKTELKNVKKVYSYEIHIKAEDCIETTVTTEFEDPIMYKGQEYSYLKEPIYITPVNDIENYIWGDSTDVDLFTSAIVKDYSALNTLVFDLKPYLSFDSSQSIDAQYAEFNKIFCTASTLAEFDNIPESEDEEYVKNVKFYFLSHDKIELDLTIIAYLIVPEV